MRRIIFAFALFLASATLSSVALGQSVVDFDDVVFEATNINSNGGGLVTFTNSGSSVRTFVRDGIFGPGNCQPCFSGVNVGLGVSYTGNLSMPGGFSGTVGGQTYPTIYTSGGLQISASGFTLPKRYTRQKFTIEVPASLTGTLNGHTENPQTNPAPAFFTSTINMKGTALVTYQVGRIAPHPNGASHVPYYRIVKVLYRFRRSNQAADSII